MFNSWWGADKAVDGNPDTNMRDGFCSQLNDGPGGPNWLMSIWEVSTSLDMLLLPIEEIAAVST